MRWLLESMPDQRSVLALGATRIALPTVYIYLMLLVVWHGVFGLASILVAMAVAGYVTEWHVRRRDGRGSAGLLSEHLIPLDDGTPRDELQRENAVRPAPTTQLAHKYAAAWSNRPEAVRRVAPRFWRALAFDLIGLELGIALFLALVIGLAKL